LNQVLESSVFPVVETLKVVLTEGLLTQVLLTAIDEQKAN